MKYGRKVFMVQFNFLVRRVWLAILVIYGTKTLIQ